MRLIDADALERHEADTYGAIEDVVYAEDIDNAPTIEAEPVKHGHWETGRLCYECSVCKNGYLGMPKTKFCPNCGAKMDEVQHAEDVH